MSTKNKKPSSRSSRARSSGPTANAVLRLQGAALTASANAIVITNRDGIIEWVNPAFAALTGYTLAEAVGQNPRDLVKSGKQSREHYQKLWDTILAGRVWHGELVNRRKDGSLYPEEMTITPVRDAAGEITHFIAIKQDLTERRRAEEAMHASELRYRRLFESAKDGILILDAETGMVVDVNPFLIDLLGFSHETFLGKKVWELGVFKDLVANQESFAELQQKKYVRFEDKPLETADGRRIEVEFVSNVYLVDRRRVIQCNIRDITERKRTEEKLRLAHERLRRFVDANIVGIVIATTAGIIIEANDYYLRLIGYTREELEQGKINWRAITPPEWLPVSEQAIREIREHGTSAPFEKEYLRRDGTRVPVLLINALLPGPEEQFTTFALDLTSLKRVEAALQQSEERYRLLFEHAPEIIFALAPTGAFTSLNRAFETITGWPPAGWIGRPFLELIHPDDRHRAGELFQQLLRGEHLPVFELRVQTAAGDYHDLELTGFVNQLSGTGLEVQGIGRDVTERKQATDALARSFSLLQASFESTADGLLVVDRAGRIVQSNRKFAEMWRIPADVMTSQDDNRTIEFVLDQLADPGSFVAKVKELYAQPEEVSFDVLAFKDGRTFERYSQPHKVGAGCVGRVWSFRDITARKAAELQLREQNEILTNAHEGVMIVNLADEILLWNRGAEEMFGRTSAEAHGRNPEQVLGLDDPAILPALRAAVERDGFWRGELRTQTRDGRSLVVDCRTTLVRNEAGQPRARLSFFSDLTEKKQIEEKFFHAQRLESIGMLAAGIAHDLNNMLAPILFAAPMLRESLSTPRDLRILDTLEQSAGRGAGLVKQILGFAHSTTGELRPTQVKHLARDIISIIEQTFPKSIELKQHIPSDLWPVPANPTQIHQVLLNLCVNARDAMPQGGTLSITAANLQLTPADASQILGGRPGNWLMFEVADTGTGIPPEVLARLWEPFFTTKELGKGTGLGLSTVRGIVANHHGFVELQTEVGHGTTFRVYLPAAEGEEAHPATALPFGGPGGHDELIVVVDDEEPIREIVAETLEANGYRVERCVDGVAALLYFQSHAEEVSLVITDIDMPRLGGVALARALLQLHPEIKLLAISGLAHRETDTSDVPAARKLVHAFLSKPFKPDELLGTVHRLLHPPGQS